jgi:hypothetical protein
VRAQRRQLVAHDDAGSSSKIGVVGIPSRFPQIPYALLATSIFLFTQTGGDGIGFGDGPSASELFGNFVIGALFISVFAVPFVQAHVEAVNRLPCAQHPPHFF